jgi:hypothetical protein
VNSLLVRTSHILNDRHHYGIRSRPIPLSPFHCANPIP